MARCRYCSATAAAVESAAVMVAFTTGQPVLGIVDDCDHCSSSGQCYRDCCTNTAPTVTKGDETSES